MARPDSPRVTHFSRVHHSLPFHTSRQGTIVPYAGLPVSAPQLAGEWYTVLTSFTSVADLPDETNDWTVIETGAGGTRTLSDDLFPPHLIITTDVLDNDSVEMQRTGAGGPGEFVDLTTGRRHYFETMIRLRDAGNTDAAVEQVDWFVGWAVTDADNAVLDGSTDFIGFSKVDQNSDATNRIVLVSGDAGGGAGLLRDQLIVPTGWTSNNPAENLTTDRNNRTLGANQWIRLAFLADPLPDGSGGSVYVWVNGTHVATGNLSGVVPNENLCTTLCIQNGEAVSKIMDVAYIFEAIEYGGI